MTSFANRVRGPTSLHPAGRVQQCPTATTSSSEEIEADLVEAISFQNCNAAIHPTRATAGERLPEGYSRSYGGFLLRQEPRIIPIDQHMVRREMEYLSKHVLLAFFVGGRPPQHSLPQWVEAIQRQVGGHVAIERNLGRGFFQI